MKQGNLPENAYVEPEDDGQPDLTTREQLLKRAKEDLRAFCEQVVANYLDCSGKFTNSTVDD